MKIMFATDNETMNSKIAKRFGHASFYLIYDTDNSSLDIRENHGHSHDHSELAELMNENIKHFVVGNIGPHAFEILKRGNAKIYLARKMTAKEALELLKNDSLEVLEQSTLKRSIENHNDYNHKHGHNHGNYR